VNAEIVPFAFQGRQVRTVMIDGAPWFVVLDLCAILEIQNAADVAAKNLDKDDVAKIYVSSVGQGRKMWATNEPGMYQLILRSNKAGAREFKRWITREVLPSIRKTGQYKHLEPGDKLNADQPFLLPAPKPHRAVFPPEFFIELFRLIGREPVPLSQAPWVAQKVTNLIWKRVEDGVFDVLNAVNPTVRAKSSGKLWRRYKLSQFVAEGPPMEKLVAFVQRCCEAMAAYSRWEPFYAHWAGRYPIKRDLPKEVRVSFADDQQLVFSFRYELAAEESSQKLT